MKIWRIELVSRSAHGQHLDDVRRARRQRHGVGDDDLLEARGDQVLEGVAGEEAVRGGRVDAAGAGVLDGVRGRREACRRCR